MSADDDTRPAPEPEDGRGKVATETQFRLLVESVRDYAIFMLDPTGHVATWNSGAERIKGYRADEIIGRHFSAFYPEVDLRAGKCEHELIAAERDGRFEDEGWRVRKDGSQFWANVVISAARDDAGTLMGFSKVTRDLSDRRRAEEERAARLVAEQATRAKDEFLAMLGHELRNPLAPIATALQLMKLRGGGDTTKEQQAIERQVAHMMRLVDDLLDVSRIVQGKIELKLERLDLREVLAKATEIASPLLEQKGHRFTISTVREAMFVEGDEARLVQVFSNLLVNAAKYTPGGGVIEVAVREAGDSVEIAVRDNGAGLAPELIDRVFELFVQGAQGIDRSRGGLGIGLALVRSLVVRHGGTVAAHSDGVQRGSTFTVRLPRVCPPHAALAPRRALAGALVSRRILIVDDNEDALMLLGEALACVGHEVRTALDPLDALELARAFQPQIAILDIGLPVMDGYELAAQLRSEWPSLRLFALTGYGQSSDRARTAAAGFARHFVKPVDLQSLSEAIASA